MQMLFYSIQIHVVLKLELKMYFCIMWDFFLLNFSLFKECVEINKINSSSCAALLPLKDNFTQNLELCHYLPSYIVADCLYIILGCQAKIQ